MAKIRITLQSDLCAGSGKSFGNMVDTDFNTDRYGLPFIPGSSIKGCLRQAAEFLEQTGLEPRIDRETVRLLFGDGQGSAGAFTVSDAEPAFADAVRALISDESFPGAGPLKKLVQREGRPGVISDMFGFVRGQTAMENGVAKKGSLRFTRVLSRYSPLDGEPLTLVAKVDPPRDPNLEQALIRCCRAVRHMGMHRNRGLGMVRVAYEADPAPAEDASPVRESGGAAPKAIEYRVALDANLVLNGVQEQLTCIPGRSVLGCMAGAYLARNKAADPSDDPVFRDLFLSGEVCWSDLTPVIGDTRTEPTPLMLTYLSNREEYVNPLTKAGREAQKDGKRKTLDGTWAAPAEDGYRIADVLSEVSYHHRHAKQGDGGWDTMLYAQTSLAPHMVYGGTVTAPAKYTDLILDLLHTADLRFGHGKNARYAACRLWLQPAVGRACEPISVTRGEKVYVILGSDLLLTGEGGQYLTGCLEVREALCEQLGLCDEYSEYDHVRFRTIGGYHAKWQLQKPQLPVVCGGSVFCFGAPKTGVILSPQRIGELRQEGLGTCHVVPEAEMDRRALVEVAGVRVDPVRDPKRAADSVRMAEEFSKAFLRYLAERTLPESAAAVWDEIRADRGLYGRLKELDNGRLRRMVEEAEDLPDLLARIRSIKSGGPRGAAERFTEHIFRDTMDDAARVERLLCGDPEVQAFAGNLDARQFWDRHWKQLLLDVLHLQYYDGGADSNGPKEERA